MPGVTARHRRVCNPLSTSDFFRSPLSTSDFFREIGGLAGGSRVRRVNQTSDFSEEIGSRVEVVKIATPTNSKYNTGAVAGRRHDAYRFHKEESHVSP